MGDSVQHNNGKFKRPNWRYGFNKRGNFSKNTQIDQNVQEATPEHMRIEIDQIIKDFLDDHEKSEYIFPTNLNNLQRKYIHFKALRMNLSSKSHGKEPNRQLHLKKKPKRIASQSFNLDVFGSIIEQLTEFQQKYDILHQISESFRTSSKWTKFQNNQQSFKPTVPMMSFVEPDIKKAREMLPIFEKRDEILDTIINNKVVVISSETGSGKTTQIPQYILEHAAITNSPCKIVCTQPRRISTLSAAERVSYERGEEVGNSVGYHIRLESKWGPETNLLYCTVGVLLRNIMGGDTYLHNITHIIVDEIHERGQLSDFLLIFLKQNLSIFSNLKVIIMSATVDTEKFTNYFQTDAVFTIPGRLYPIQNYFLEDILVTINFFTPQMRMVMDKLQQKHNSSSQSDEQVAEVSFEDQLNFNSILQDYMDFSPNYDYTIHYDEATADLLQLFISENVSVDLQHSEKGWTALMVASHLGDINLASKLCAMGANIDIHDHMGKTATDYAELAQKPNILQLLQYYRERKSNPHEISGALDAQKMLQLYDMTTPDDLINYELILSLIKFIHLNGTEGAILIFLPGYDEIMQCNDYIENSDLNSNTYKVYFLHSSMDIKDQRGVFMKLPNMRKIVLSTNIAETSVTIPDVVYVVDVGKAKEKVYDSYNKLSSLQTQWISKACSKQREGRAGRVKPGCCFKLYSSQRFAYMSDERVPEILRVSLEELCLSAKVIACKSMKIYEFLSLAPDPPRVNSINASIENLQSLGALDKDEGLTKLGECLSQLTAEPRLGKMLIYSCIFRCLEPMLTLVAAMAHKDPFQLPSQANLKVAAAAKRTELIGGISSDHIIYLRVFNKWQEEYLKGRSRKFCREYFISESVMTSVLETRRQFIGQLRSIGFINKNYSLDEYNINGFSWGLIKAIMVGAFFPNIAFPLKNGVFLGTKTDDKVTIHHSSICKEKRYKFWYFYDEMVKNRNNFMVRGVTLTTPLSVALLCGVDAAYTSSTSVNIDNWIEFIFKHPVLLTFRSALQDLLNDSIINPLYSFEDFNKLVIETMRNIMDIEEQQSGFIQPVGIGMKPKFLNNASGRRNTNRNYQVPANADDNWRDHRGGKTPKRYIPRYQKNVPSSSNASKRINFNGPPQYGYQSMPSTSRSTNQMYGDGMGAMQGSSYSENRQPNADHSPMAAEALLRGLNIRTEDDTDVATATGPGPAPGPSHRSNGRSKRKHGKKSTKQKT